MKIENLTNPNRADNPINGDYLKYTYDNGSTEKKYYWEPIPEDKNVVERGWRDSELQLTDFIVPLTDHPQHAAYMTYRQELRDYPAQEDFPNGTRPVKP
jgi:hypothetical protein